VTKKLLVPVPSQAETKHLIIFGGSVLTGGEAFNRIARMVASRWVCRAWGNQGRMRTSRSMSELNGSSCSSCCHRLSHGLGEKSIWVQNESSDSLVNHGYLAGDEFS